MDRDYQLHLRTLKAMTQKKCDSGIRIRRLQQFRLDCDQTLPEQGQGRNCLSVLINKFEMYRQKLDDSAQISLECQFSTKKVRSIILPITNFQGSNFRFRFKKKWIKQGSQINIFVRYHKGNSDNELGYFTIDPTEYVNSENKQNEQQQTKPIIKRIGTVAGALAIDLKFYRIF